MRLEYWMSVPFPWRPAAGRGQSRRNGLVHSAPRVQPCPPPDHPSERRRAGRRRGSDRREPRDDPSVQSARWVFGPVDHMGHIARHALVACPIGRQGSIQREVRAAEPTTEASDELLGKAGEEILAVPCPGGSARCRHDGAGGERRASAGIGTAEGPSGMVVPKTEATWSGFRRMSRTY
jgi:hypothetical protein